MYPSFEISVRFYPKAWTPQEFGQKSMLATQPTNLLDFQPCAHAYIEPYMNCLLLLNYFVPGSDFPGSFRSHGFFRIWCLRNGAKLSKVLLHLLHLKVSPSAFPGSAFSEWYRFVCLINNNNFSLVKSNNMYLFLLYSNEDFHQELIMFRDYGRFQIWSLVLFFVFLSQFWMFGSCSLSFIHLMIK